MANKIDDSMIEYVGILAKLDLEGDEKEQACAEMEKMLDYIDKINELDTDGVEPLIQVIDCKNVFREDVVTNENDRDNILSNAPEQKDGQYVVPRTFLS